MIFSPKKRPGRVPGRVRVLPPWSREEREESTNHSAHLITLLKNFLFVFPREVRILFHVKRQISANHHYQKALDQEKHEFPPWGLKRGDPNH
jgi:hypothetical protein